MPEYNVILKTVEAVKIASKREQLASYEQAVVGPALGRMTQAVIEHVERQSGKINWDVQCGIVLWHDNDDPEQSKASDIDVEAAIEIKTDVTSNASINVYDLPETQMACAIHHGDFSGLGVAKSAIFAWVEENDYHIAGPIREVYLQFEPDNPANCITEVQFPVEKR